MSKPIVIYHGNCADGFSAAWAFWSKFKDEMEYYPGVYQKEPPNVTNRDVYLVDFSYKRDVVEQMLKVAKSVTLIDHHKSALDDLANLPGLKYHCSLDNSGAMLAWTFVYGGVEPPMLLRHVEDRDLWRFAIHGTREIQAAVFSHEYDFHVWDRLMRMDPRKLYEQGVALERKHFKDIRELIAFGKRRLTIGGHDVPACNLPYTMTSDAGHIMAEGEKFAACYMDKADGTRYYSLRSQDDGIDVSEIAKQYGGGGHAHAAGFSVPHDHELGHA